MILASTYVNIGIGIAALVAAGWAVYGLINIRLGRPEVGSEIELAANRKPYYDDDTLETTKLDRTLRLGVLGLAIVAMFLPLYWLREPSRQAGALNGYEKTFAARGEEMFAPTEQGGFNCAGCHGPKGVGGVANYTITDSNGKFVAQVKWQAPALNTVLLRYSREEVTYVLTYGRPYSPMPAWGLTGGGPLNDQQLQNLVDYMATIQLSPKEARAAAEEELKKAMATGAWKSEGEALFNLGYADGFAGGAYACGRCHTQGWTYGEKGPDGGGAFGPNLYNVEDQFPDAKKHIEFVTEGSEEGKLYGVHGQGSGRMPAFGQMLTADQIKAIVEYERSLGSTSTPEDKTP
jgi:mono/diheme cytochrome c family protein